MLALYTPQRSGDPDMKKVLLLMTVLVAGCNHASTKNEASGEWILESYDIHTGYTLRKDGGQYVAHCIGAWYTPKQSRDSAHGLSHIPPGARIEGLPPANEPENSCAEILPYLHKAVPFSQSGDVLTFKDKDRDYTTELMVTDAK